MISHLIQNVKLFLDDKPSIFALREKAKDALIKTGFPTKKTEAWKYTNVEEILKANLIVNTKDTTCDHSCCHEKNDTPFIEINFCNGQLHVEDYTLPKGLIVQPLPLALYENEYKKYIFNSFNLEDHPFAALNGIYLEQGLCIQAEKGTKLTKPIRITYNNNVCNNLQLNIHNIFIAEKESSLEIIEEYRSKNNQTHLTNIVNEIYLGPQATLNHYKIQKEDISAYHLALNAVKQQKESSYKQFYLSDGAKISRQETIVNLEQPDSKTEIYSAYKAKKDCLNDITTNVYHLVKDTTSNQYAKAVLEENSTAVFQGKIHISPNAINTDGHQLHRALYLDDTASLNCKPELEIYADNVKCSHGASSGGINEEQLFYLKSRGIKHDDAIKILTKAHMEEIFAFIPNKCIKELFFFSE